MAIGSHGASEVAESPTSLRQQYVDYLSHWVKSEQMKPQNLSPQWHIFFKTTPTPQNHISQ